MTHKPAERAIVAAHQKLSASLPFADTADMEDAARGFLAALSPAVVHAPDGRLVWDNDRYSFLSGEAPVTVNPSLWRQSGLVAKQGLFEVVDGIYQVRGLDLSNITFVEGDTGVIVIDPLISTETAAAALKLYRSNRGERPVVAVIYTHSHIDHFGGVFGVTTQEDADAGRVEVIARRVLWSMLSRKTSMPARRWDAGPATCTAPPSRAARRDRSAPALAKRPRWAKSV